jgi:hypothetical protein
MTDTVDLERLARGVHLDVTALGAGRFRVTGGATPHEVDARAGVCDCADYTVRGGTCKHLASVRLRLGDPATLAALRGLVPYPRRPRRRAS